MCFHWRQAVYSHGRCSKENQSVLLGCPTPDVAVQTSNPDVAASAEALLLTLHLSLAKMPAEDTAAITGSFAERVLRILGASLRDSSAPSRGTVTVRPRGFTPRSSGGAVCS